MGRGDESVDRVEWGDLKGGIHDVYVKTGVWGMGVC